MAGCLIFLSALIYGLTGDIIRGEGGCLKEAQDLHTFSIDLIGLNHIYMKKLSIYLQKRLKKQAVIRVWEQGREGQIGVDTQAQTRIVLAGETFMHRIREYVPDPDACICLTVTNDRQLCSDEVLYMYQPADALCSRILKSAQKADKAAVRRNAQAGPQIYTFFGADSSAGLFAYSMTCAKLLSADRQTLFVNLCSCSGMRRLLGLAPAQTDLSDLFVALRKGRQSDPLSYTGHTEGLDYILPLENPGILDELTAEDLELFIQNLHTGTYDAVVIAQDGMHAWTKSLIACSAHVICLTDHYLPTWCRYKEMYAYYERCGGRKEKWTELKTVPVLPVETGEHLLSEWENGCAGELVRRMLAGLQEGACDDGHREDDTRQDSGDAGSGAGIYG